jgi:hypothetical protein
MDNYNMNMSVMNDLFVENKYESYLTVNFLENFFKNILDENNQVQYIIITKIRNKIIDEIRND